MSNLKYYTCCDFGEWASENLNYSQTVRIGDKIEASGQGGVIMEIDGITFPKDINEEIDQAFRNVDIVLKATGGKGWSQVYRVNTYHTSITPEISARIVENYKKWMPDHKPIWTQIGVKQLGVPDMNVEIEVVAYDPEGAKEAKTQTQ